MFGVYEKKKKALKDIFDAYIDFIGAYTTSLEIKIDSLKDKLSEQDLYDLKFELYKYTDFVFSSLASSSKVFVKFSDNISDTFKDLKLD